MRQEFPQGAVGRSKALEEGIAVFLDLRKFPGPGSPKDM